MCGQVRREALLLLATQINASGGILVSASSRIHHLPWFVCVPVMKLITGRWRELLGNQTWPPPACGTLLSQLIKKKGVFSLVVTCVNEAERLS